MVTKWLNKITQNETQDPQLVDNFCKSWVNNIVMCGSLFPNRSTTFKKRFRIPNLAGTDLFIFSPFYCKEPLIGHKKSSHLTACFVGAKGSTY